MKSSRAIIMALLVVTLAACGVKIAPSPQLTEPPNRYKIEAARRTKTEATRQGKAQPTPTPTPAPTPTPDELPPQQ